MRLSRELTSLCAGLCLLSAGCSTSPSAWVEKGKKATAAGKYAEAEIDYLKAIQAKSDFGEAWYGLGIVRLKQSHLADAWYALTRASDLLPSRRDEVAVNLGDAGMAIYLSSAARPADMYQRIVAISADLLKHNPNSYDGLRLKGFVAMIDRHYPEAIELLKKADAMKPGQGDITQALMESLIQNSQGTEAEKLGTAFLARQKNFIPIYDVLYRYYMSDRREGEAERLLKDKIAANAGDLPSRMQLGRHYLVVRKEAEMSGALQQVADDARNFPDGRLAVGDFYRLNNRLEDALRTFQAGAALGGKQKTVYQQRSADVLVAMGRSAQAIPVLQDILKTDPANFPARSLRAAIRLDSGTSEDAQAAFADLMQLAAEEPKDALIHYNLGRAWLAKGNTEAALSQFQEGLRQNPLLLQARVLAADVSMRRGDYTLARQYSDELVDQTGGHPAARLLRAAALTGAGSYDEAGAVVRQLNEEFPNAIEPKLQLGALRMAQKRYAEAEELFRALYGSSRKDFRALTGLINAMAGQEHFDAAIQLINQEKLKPGAPVAKLDALLAETALRGRKLDMAVQQYSRLTSAAPGSAFDHLRLGDAYLQKGDTRQAVSQLETARNLNPKDLPSSAMLALALGKSGNDAEAERAYREAIALQPQSAVLKNNLAFLLAEKGRNLDDALRLAREASRQQPGSIPLADTLAYVYLKKNLPDSAIQILSNATQKEPKHPLYRYHLAMALLEKGDKSGAKRECEAALASNPTRDDEEKIRAMLSGLR